MDELQAQKAAFHISLAFRTWSIGLLDTNLQETFKDEIKIVQEYCNAMGITMDSPIKESMELLYQKSSNKNDESFIEDGNNLIERIVLQISAKYPESVKEAFALGDSVGVLISLSLFREQIEVPDWVYQIIESVGKKMGIPDNIILGVRLIINILKHNKLSDDTITLLSQYLNDTIEEIESWIDGTYQKGIIICFKTGSPCKTRFFEDEQNIFIGISFNPKNENIYKYGITPTLKKYKLNPWKADIDIRNIDIMCKICESIQKSRFCIIDISDWNPNVMFELGLAFGLRKKVIIIKSIEGKIPADLRGIEYIEYNNTQTLKKKLSNYLRGAL